MPNSKKKYNMNDYCMPPIWMMLFFKLMMGEENEFENFENIEDGQRVNTFKIWYS